MAGRIDGTLPPPTAAIPAAPAADAAQIVGTGTATPTTLGTTPQPAQTPANAAFAYGVGSVVNATV